MLVVRTYERFNHRRYSNPWIAQVTPTGKPDFTTRVGGYTGGFNRGEAGQLYLTHPVEGKVYAFGQKDHRGNNTVMEYVQIVNSQPVSVPKTALVAALNP